MKKNLSLLALFVAVLGMYFGVEYISSRPTKDSTIHLDFQKLTYNDFRSKELQVMSGEVLVDGISQPTDPEKLKTFFDDLRKIQVKTIASKKKENFPTFGITESSPTIEIGDKKFFLGGFPDYESQFIRPDGEDVVYLIDENISGMLMVKKPDFFKPTAKESTSSQSSATTPNLTSVQKTPEESVKK